MGLSMSINGTPCDPVNCLVVSPGNWTFSGSALASGNVVDTTWSLQSINPAGSGGTVSVVTTADANASSVSASIGGVDLSGSAAGIASIVNGQIVETLTLQVGASGKTAGDFQGVWVAAPPQPPVCGTCVPPPMPPDVPVPLPTLDLSALIVLAIIVGAVGGLWEKLNEGSRK